MKFVETLEDLREIYRQPRDLSLRKEMNRLDGHARGFLSRSPFVVIASQDRRPLVAKALVDLDRLLGSSVSDYIRVHAAAPVLLVREAERRG